MDWSDWRFTAGAGNIIPAAGMLYLDVPGPALGYAIGSAAFLLWWGIRAFKARRHAASPPPSDEEAAEP
ncbi:hypothetical protein [Nocardiopsis sp. CNT312]|uniref:hypothetical protein n=1 Tax=Nocardiopsis sp. CNT312 TaxID=1137268 RepID=UPI0004B837F1|nr:hypothetical protein [Nocardiopsis sp. CNT312]